MDLKKQVLDKGYIEIFSVSMPLLRDEEDGKVNYTVGDPDIIPVNTARVSYGSQVKTLEEKDEKLMRFLKEHGHTSPFRHIYVGLRVKAPEMVGRQWWKHCIGSEYTFQDNPWNEISGRYVTLDEEFYVPSQFGKQPDKKHQGGVGYVDDNEQTEANRIYADLLSNATDTYARLLELGVSKEHARLVMPISFYTQYVWTASLQALQHFIRLRDDDHAQWEIRQYAIALRELLQIALPKSAGIFIG